MIAYGYMSSTSFYVFLIITIILIFILCISNIVAYANILANNNVEFNRTWAKILIALNAILIAIAFIIMIILIIKFMKGRTRVVAGAPAAGAGAGAGAAGGNPTIGDLYNIAVQNRVNWDDNINGFGGDCVNPFSRGCSGDLHCSDGTNVLPCPGNTRNDDAINTGYRLTAGRGLI
jgi:hypothetical protein